MRFRCYKYVQFVNIIIKMNILRIVCLNKSYLYINIFTYFYPVILVKLMCVYFAYILCFRITLFHLNTVIGVLFLGIFVKKHSIACKFIYLCVFIVHVFCVFFSSLTFP